MNISEFIRQFRNHPVLFVGTGLSLRCLENSFSRDESLKKICFELKGNNEFYYEVKSNHCYDGKYKYDEIASDIQNELKGN